MNENLSLTEQITKRILDEIRHGIYKDEQRLPPEKEIALRIGVSRTVIRDALSVLEREGFINRKHGIGTIINLHVLKIANRMDLEQEFSEEVQACGYTPSRKQLSVCEECADELVSKHLEIPLGAPVITTTCIIFADNKPAIYCTDYFSKDLIINNNYTDNDFNNPIFDFLEKFCEIEIHMDITEVRAIAASSDVARNLDLAFATPVLFMQEIGYTFLGRPVLFSKEYYADGIFHHTLLRKKI